MNLKKLFFLLGTTLLIGGVASLIVGFLLKTYLGDFVWWDLLLMGLTFSAVSMLGFFAYLIFQWLAVGYIASKKIYQGLLVIFLSLVIGNLFWLNVYHFWGQGFWVAISIPVIVIVVAVLVTWFKVASTNKTALIPTMFFMITATTFEAVPSLDPKTENVPFITTLFTMLILLICNAWQILQLHRLVGKKEKS